MLPLAEITVVITRPRGQADELRRELEAFGATVVLFPTIEIAAPESYADLDAAVNNLSNYDWLILTSTNAAEHFLSRLEANGLETVELDNLRLCVVGEATAERMRLAQAHVDVLPTESNAEGVFTALCEYLGGESELNGLRFLMPRSAIGRDILPAKLRESGATVKDITAYRTVLPEKPDTARIKTLLQVGAVDCLTFTSPSTFQNLLQILSGADLPHLLKDAVIACIGETTAQAVRDKGFVPHLISDAPDASSFARNIAKYFQEQ
jgi:uroporphyrinogen III methyltransferase / synthase